MNYKGIIEQVTIFGQLEFIESETYSKKSSKKDNYTNVSGDYKVTNSDEVISVTLEFYNKDLKRHERA